MRSIDAGEITGAIRRLCMKANFELPADLCRTIESCAAKEQSPVGQAVLKTVIENYTYAAQNSLPICQDTGMAVVFADIGQEVMITGGDFTDAVNEGVRRGYTDGYLRCSVISDPLRRASNTNDNTPAVLHVRIVAGDRLTLTVAPKGFGSENMSRLKLFTPAAGIEDIERFVVDTVTDAGANPCPPVVLGVGIGGTAEQAMLIAKRSLLRPAGEHNPDPFYAQLEERFLQAVNRTGIGPQGLGGTVTALCVNIDFAPTHIAGLPCAVNMGCHVTRHAQETL